MNLEEEIQKITQRLDFIAEEQNQIKRQQEQIWQTIVSIFDLEQSHNAKKHILINACAMDLNGESNEGDVTETKCCSTGENLEQYSIDSGSDTLDTEQH